MSQIYKTAIVGLGNIGFKFELDPKRKEAWSHSAAYKACDRTELVAAVEPGEENKQLFAERYPFIPVYANARDLFSRHKDIDIVSVCVPTDMHFDVMCEILDFPVRAIFSEKPLTSSPALSRRVLAKANDKGVLLQVNYLHRWYPAFHNAYAEYKAGYIGEIKALNAFYPGRIFNMGSHLFSAIIMFLGARPLRVSAVTVKDGPDPFLAGWIQFENALMCSFSATGKREDLVFEVDLVGTQGRIRVLDGGARVEKYLLQESPRYTGYRELVKQQETPFGLENAFVDAVQDIVAALDAPGRAVRTPGHDGFVVDCVIDAALRSAANSGIPEDIIAYDN